MRPGVWSRTAEAAAAMRAAHLLLDDEPRIHDDPYAARLLGLDARVAPLLLPFGATLRRRRMRSFLPQWLRARWPTGARRTRSQILVRSRYAEDRLAKAVEGGVRQYVILAAGLDTFALRHADSGAGLQIFEVDHPDSQAHKRERLATLGLPAPQHLIFAPCDFERQSLAEALAETPYDPGRPAFFSWLGVTYYLTREAIAATLDFVARQAAGSEIVFDYWCDQDAISPADAALLAGIRMGVASQAEPIRTLFQPGEVRRLSREHCVELTEDLSPAAAQRRYLAGRLDGLRLPTFAWLAHGVAGK